MSFGKRFSDLVELLGAKIPEMAVAFDMDASALSKWKTRPEAPGGAVAKIARYFVIPEPVMGLYLIDGEELPVEYRTPKEWRIRQAEADKERRFAERRGELSPPSALEVMLTLSRFPDSELREAFHRLSEPTQQKLLVILREKTVARLK